MRRLTGILIVGMALAPTRSAIGADSAGADDGRSSSRGGFDAFRIVFERNIFDAGRRRDLRPEPFNPRPPAPAPVVVERIALNGAFINRLNGSAEAVAFFSGSDPRYNGSVKKGETIAGFQIVEIRTDRVRLINGGHKIDLPIGAGLERRGDDPWQVVAVAAPSRTSSGGNRPSFGGRRPSFRGSRGDGERGSGSGERESGSTGEKSTAEAQSSGSSADDMIKKMMERRQKEMEK